MKLISSTRILKLFTCMCPNGNGFPQVVVNTSPISHGSILTANILWDYNSNRIMEKTSCISIFYYPTFSTTKSQDIAYLQGDVTLEAI